MATVSALITMTGSAVEYTIPALVTEVVFIMRGANIIVKAPSTGTGVTLVDGASIGTKNPNDQGTIWSFNGANGSYVDVFYTLGVPR